MAFHETMLQDHERIDALLGSMIEAAHNDDPDGLGRRWDLFEAMLLAHMNGEELFLLPALEKHDPKRATEIRADHAKIRELLATIAIELDLHMVNEQQMRALKRHLDAHARAEEADFYRWAEEALPQSTLASVVRRIGDRIDRIKGAAAKVA